MLVLILVLVVCSVVFAVAALFRKDTFIIKLKPLFVV